MVGPGASSCRASKVGTPQERPGRMECLLRGESRDFPKDLGLCLVT